MPIQINPTPAPLTPGLREALLSVSFATIGHLLEEGFVDPAIRPVVTPVKMVGRAVTVRTTAPDSALVHVATEILTEGDVLVIGLGGDTRHAPVGEMVALAAHSRGAAGIVVDGVCTDVIEVRSLGLPVFARGTTLLTTKLLGLNDGAINTPLVCGGVTVRSGDVVLGDDNGLLVLPPETALWAATEARTRDVREPALRAYLRGGGSLAEWSGANQIVARLQSGGPSPKA
jgi:4-hydroxy-4-methyl-2-oxoglutarate aldolase